MIIHMHDKKMYHLDCDLTSQITYDHKDTIRIMVCLYIKFINYQINHIIICTLTNNNNIDIYKQGHVMLNVLQIVFETQDLLFGFDGMDSWDIVEARGIPNHGSMLLLKT